MKIKSLNSFYLLADTVERISDLTETDIPDIVDALIGVAWDEKDASDIKQFHSSEEDMD